MSDQHQSFADEFVQASGAESEAAERHRRELNELLERQLTHGDKVARIVAMLLAIVFVGFCGRLLLQQASSPLYPVIPPISLIVVMVWYLGFAVLYCFGAIRGRFSERKDGAMFRTWNLWCAGLLTGVLLLWWHYHPDIEHRDFYAIVTLFGFLALAVEAVLHRIKCAELANREKLLELKVLYTQLAAKRLNSPG